MIFTVSIKPNSLF